MNDAATQAATIGVIGDVHLFWDDEDVAFFNSSGYDLLLFVGDLAAYTQVRGQRVARSIRALRTPAMCIPGNHDGLHALQLGAEIAPRAHRLRNAFCEGQARRCRSLEKALGDVELVAYTQRRVAPAGVPLNIVVCRPHSIGGRRLACLRYLDEAYGVDSMESSVARLKSLVDACDDSPILFLAHNGPSGKRTGATATSRKPYGTPAAKAAKCSPPWQVICTARPSPESNGRPRWRRTECCTSTQRRSRVIAGQMG
ncbi:MAG: metallophosphoesterase [Deltaproteobacteria bacterium]|nr:metallophosphoesterase [Deltaproteobacteria bacterium]